MLDLERLGITPLSIATEPCVKVGTAGGALGKYISEILKENVCEKALESATVLHYNSNTFERGESNVLVLKCPGYHEIQCFGTMFDV